MARDEVLELIQRLGVVMDLQRVLEEAGMAPAEALDALKSKRGRLQLKALRLLARIHIEVLAQRYGPLALSKLCGLLGDDKKPELQMKGALAVLAVAGLDERGAAKKARRGKEGEGAGERLPAVDSAQATEVLRTVAEVLTSRRRTAAMGQGPATIEKECI